MDSVRRIGTQVRAARRAAHLTQRDLADLSGVSERSIRDIEKGTGSASFAAVATVATTLGLEISAS